MIARFLVLEVSDVHDIMQEHHAKLPNIFVNAIQSHVHHNQGGYRMNNRVSKIDIRGVVNIGECPFETNIHVRCVWAQTPGSYPPGVNFVCECDILESAPQTQLIK